MKSAWLALLVCLLNVTLVGAQDTALPEVDTQSWDVFLRYDEDPSTDSELIFLNLLTSETATLRSNGERFSLLESGVMYFDRDEAQVKFATPDGVTLDHPFVSVFPQTYRIDWIVSNDRQTIAWTVTRRDEDNLLRTLTMIADIGAEDGREVLAAGPWQDSRVLPVAFSPEKDELYLDVHPEGVDGHLPYSLYANLFALDLREGTMGRIRLLPGESSCYCSAAFANDIFLRLPPDAGLRGVDVKIDSVNGGEPRMIPALDRSNFTQAGDVLMSPDGALAIYTLSQNMNEESADEPALTVFVVANLETLDQSVVGNPITGLVYPINWTEDNSAVLFTNARQSGTWKLHLSDETVSKVAEARYLGRLLSQ